MLHFQAGWQAVSPIAGGLLGAVANPAGSVGAMETTDLTVTILRELRDGQTALRQELRADQQGLRDELREFREEMRESREQADRRFEAIETTLRDLAQQMVMLGRAMKVTLDSRAANESRLDDHERRLRALEDATRT